MTILKSVFGLFIFVLSLWLTLFFPYRYNEYFEEKYGHRAWSTGAAVVQAVCTIYLILTDGDHFNPIALIITIIVYVICLTQSYRFAISHGAIKSDAIKAVISQFFAPCFAITVAVGFVIAIKNVVDFFDKKE